MSQHISARLLPPILLELLLPQSFKAAESKDEIGEEIRLVGAVDVQVSTACNRNFQSWAAEGWRPVGIER